MRTILTQAHITAILAKHFEEVNFVQYHVLDDGRLAGALVDHAYEVKLPDTSEWE